jgi:acetoacetyl-CoA reductase
MMVEQNWGRIINISSIVGQQGNFGQTNYAAAKGGLIAFTKALARDLARKNMSR